MTNYDLINSDKCKYLIHITQQMYKLEKLYNELFEDRDIKLKVILEDDFEKAYNSAIETINEIKSEINNLNLTSLNIPNLESISVTIDSMFEYYKYFKNQ